PGQKKLLREPPSEGNPGIGGGFDKRGEVAAHELRPVGLINRSLKQVPEGVMERDVEDRAAYQRGEPRHGFTVHETPYLPIGGGEGWGEGVARRFRGVSCA